jgi:predicted NUDIX family NTP pyrophosphohydrolase
VTRRSAGILLYRLVPEPEVLIAHMGGPFWARKDAGAWSIPKGEFDPETESAWDAAQREFEEELGVRAPVGEEVELGTFAYASGKTVTVFLLAGAGFTASGFVFGTFELEWPPRSGRLPRPSCTAPPRNWSTSSRACSACRIRWAPRPGCWR